MPGDQNQEMEQGIQGKNPAAVALGKLGGKKGGLARARNLSPAERSEIASKAAEARWGKRGEAAPGGTPGPAWATFKPRLTILPPGQRALWPELRGAARMGFVLYGGTAIALRLGHRQSVGFDFCTERAFDRRSLVQAFPFLERGLVIQEAMDSLTYNIDPLSPGQGTVKLSFFTVGTGRVWDPQWTEDGVALVAAMNDLLAHQLKVLMQRVELKDYLHVHALIRHGFRLEDGLAVARALFGRAFQPAQALKALTWFQDGDLSRLPARVKKELVAASAKVQDLPPVPEVHPDLGGGGA